MKPIHDPRPTIHIIGFLAAAVLGGCGVETATTAATGAAIKKQEIEQGKATMEQARQKIDQATEQMQRARAETDAASSQ